MKLVIAASLGLAAAVSFAGDAGPARRGIAEAAAAQTAAAQTAAAHDDSVDASILRGRAAVISHACADCHGGWTPDRDGYLAGRSSNEEAFPVGPMMTWPRNLTPDSATGVGRYTERQIFNALRYGLRPSTTPDVDITAVTPGQGNFPVKPDYLAPSMPWVIWRQMPDQTLRDIATYLKRGVKPVRHQVPTSQAPPDLWASEFTLDKTGPYPLPAFPTSKEMMPEGGDAVLTQVLRGRQVVSQAGCSGCHGAQLDPAGDGWMVGVRAPKDEYQIGPFRTRPRNLTPDNTTGMGRFTERQIFNSLRYGLRPGETPDVDITSTVPGEGNHPANPKYLAPPMPWPAWRHMPDEDLRAIAMYLKRGVKPMTNRVADSEGPPDFWASENTAEKIGRFPVPAFPTAKERTPK